MRKAVLICTFIFSFALIACAQEQQPLRPLPDTLLVGADGEYEAVPDTAVLSFVIAAQESDPQAAFSRDSQAAERVRNVLKSNGIDPKTAELSRYQLQAITDYKDPKRKIVAYRVSTSVTIKLKDFNKAGPLLQGLSGIDEVEGQNLGYMLEQIEDAKNKAVEQAYARARSYAETLAKASGRTLGDLSYASIDVRSSEIPYPVLMSANRALAAPQAPPPTEGFGQQKSTITAHVTALFKLR